MLIDTHAHLNFKAFNNDLEVVIKRAKESGIKKIIIPGAKIDSSKRAVEISRKFDSCFAAIGIHPHHVDEYANLGKERVEDELKKMLKQVQHDKLKTKVVAIGEAGLDYHEYRGYPPITDNTKNQQKELLILQINIAQEYNLPIIFHCRDAYDDQLDLIGNYIKSSNKDINGVFHCFWGDKSHLKKVLELGFYVGFDGNITYPDNQKLQDLVNLTPYEKLLLETDSPYLTPQKLRGQRNEPTFLIHTLTFISQIYRIKPDKLADTTSQNALKLFNL